MNKRLLFIYNQHAGKTRIKNHLVDILDLFTKAGYEVTVHPTQFGGDARESVIHRDENYDLVVCSGGDGTLDEVVTGMMKSENKTPIGYIPAGSTNDFATSLCIPKTMLSAARTVTCGTCYPCDIGRFNDDIFVYIAAFGLFTEVSYETRQEVKNVLGHMAYIIEGMKRLSSISAYKMHVEGDNVDIEGEFIYGMITNSTSVGGFKKITGSHVKLNDGLFEVTLIKKPKNAVELQKILSALMGASIDFDYMYCFKTTYLRIESDEAIAWTLDGEFGGKHTKVLIEDDKQALDIIVPCK